MARINWEEIKTKYVYGIEKEGKIIFPSTRDLADEYNISRGLVGERASKDGWVKLREQYMSESRAKVEQKLREHITSQDFDFDSELLDKAKKVIQKLDTLIENPTNSSKYLAIAGILKQLEELKKEILGEKSVTDSITVSFFKDE